MSQELSAYVAFYGTAVSIIRPAIIAALLIGLWAALRRTDLPPATRTRTWLAVALPLVAWFASSGTSPPQAHSKHAQAHCHSCRSPLCFPLSSRCRC